MLETKLEIWTCKLLLLVQNYSDQTKIQDFSETITERGVGGFCVSHHVNLPIPSS